VLTTKYLISRLPTLILNNVSSIESFLSLVSSTPLVSSLPSWVFWSFVFVHSYNPNHSKLDPKALKSVFIGYPPNKKRYKCYHPESFRVYITIDATFHETKYFFVSPTLKGEKTLEEEELLFLSLQYLSLQDDTTTNEIKPTYSEVEDNKFFSKKYQRRQPTLISEQEELSILEGRIRKGSSEEVSVTENLPITLRKGKNCVKYLFLSTSILTIFIIDIKALSLPQKFLH